MKKVILSTLAAAALVTTASAEMKFGVGVDVMTNISNPAASMTGGQSFGANIGSVPVIRVAIDGLVDGLRVEPRIAYTKSENPNGSQSDSTGYKGNIDATMTAYGIGAYYDLTKVISIGASYDMYTMTTTAVKSTTDASAGAETKNTGSSLGIVLKAEANIAENFTIASELGFASTTTTPGQTGAKVMSDLHPISSVTLRYFF